jgi:hypothetical protein
MTKTVCLFFALTIAAAAEMWIPEGTPVRVRLGEDLPRFTAEAVGQPVEFSVIEEVRVLDKVVIAVGAQAIGTRVLTNGDLDHKPSINVVIDRVRAIDGSWIPLRYAAKKNAGSVLVRIDQQKDQPADPNILLPRGATFSLYVDESEITAAAAERAARNQRPGILQWLVSQIDPAMWTQRWFPYPGGIASSAETGSADLIT